MINDDDPMMLYMIEGCRSSLYIRSLNEDKDNSEETDIELFLMEIPNPEMPVPVTKFQNRITMKSDKFHNICKHLNNNSTFVEIKSINNEIIFVGQNEGGKVTMSCRDTEYNSAGKDTNQVVQGMYELRNLLGFSKCNKLCNTIELYLKNDFPLVLVISVATLGKMYVFLSPIENGNN
nr:cell nuclear antigen [Mimivirus sp.]